MINIVAIVETKAAKAPAATMQAIRTPLLSFLCWISGFTAAMRRSYEKYRSSKGNKAIETLYGFPGMMSAITLWQLKEVKLTTQEKV